MTIIDRAKYFAQLAHQYQPYGELPYIFHIEHTVEIARELKYCDFVITACYLHDTIEDTHITYDKIEKYFGKQIANIVEAVTDEKAHTRKMRKELTYKKIQKIPYAIQVKLCDRISNMINSKWHDEKKYKMYLKEQDSFKSNLLELMINFMQTDIDAIYRGFEYLEKIIE